jgi:hypothetical protein
MEQYPRTTKYNIETQEGYDLLLENISEDKLSVVYFLGKIYFVMLDSNSDFVVLASTLNQGEKRITNSDLYQAIFDFNLR